MPKRLAVLILLVLGFATPALAASKPAEIGGVIHATKPYGEGAVRFLFITAYDATLWTDAPHWSMNAPFALVLHYGMGFSTDDLVSRSIKEMRHVAPGTSEAKLQQYKAALTRVFPDVKSGDTITALYVPGRPVQFFLDGRQTGEVADPGFAAPFFAIWLSPQTSDPDLRAKLLSAGK